MTPKQRKARNAYERERRRLHRLHCFEYAVRERGFTLVGGVDEVGRGPLAGPVVAACVVAAQPLMIKGLNDSKQVRPETRVAIAEIVKAQAIAWAVGSASVHEIDRLNIYWASILAMERAIGSLSAAPEYLITDAVRIRSYAGPQEPVIHGDARCAVVAAASILAKVHRDALMVELDREDSRYGFALHKGYSTPHHIAALRTHGPSVHHRANWWRVRDAQLALGLDTLEVFESVAE
ncbi:MAG TPA: ribonuclease HII [Candidatus Cybelea sp.]|jgi:ribonuclease HII|nr:ribonuclease HII [Candidatus Cybelea sp.]